jgi:hypothetical protein
MDNFHIDVTSEGRENLKRALEIALQHAPGNAAIAFRSSPRTEASKGNRTGEPRLILYWHQEAVTGPATPRPFGFKMKLPALLAFVEEWLGQQDYGKAPGHDGSNGKGWRAFNEAWGRVGDDTYSFLAIEPSWAWYGK